MSGSDLKKPHYKSVIFASYLNMMRTDFPHIDLKKLCAECGLDLSYIEDESNWVSIEFEKRFMDKIYEVVNDSNVYYRAGTKGVSEEGVGKSLYFIGRYVVSLESLYSTLPKLTKLLNKVINIEIKKVGRGQFSFAITPLLDGLTIEEQDTLISRMPIMMENTRGYYSAIPTVKGLPPAKVDWVERRSSDGTVTYEMSVNYISGAHLLEKIGTVGPLLFGLFGWGLCSFVLNVSAVAAITLGFILFILGTTLSLFLANRNLSKIAAQAEEALFKLDEQYRSLFQTQSQLNRKLGEVQAIYKLVGSLIEAQTEETVLEEGCRELVTHLRYDRAFVLVESNNELRVASSHGFDADLREKLKHLTLPISIEDNDPNKFSNVYKFQRALLVKNVREHVKKLSDPTSQSLLEVSGSISFAAVPISTRSFKYGILVADCGVRRKLMDEEDVSVLSTAAHQIGIALEKQRAKQELVSAYESEVKVAESYSRFVPWETLKGLSYKNIFDVRLGDGVEKDLVVLFSDIRDFTTLSESMSPRDVLKFLNSYYQKLSPLIKAQGGYIDKYIGDAVMAIFPDLSSAIQAAIQIQRTIVAYNLEHRVGERQPIRAGVGICAGPVIFGPLGSDRRLEITAVSDTVNTASRMDGLCKQFDADILVAINDNLQGAEVDYPCIDHGTATVKGKSKLVRTLELVDPQVTSLVKVDCSTTKQRNYLASVENRNNDKIKQTKNAADIFGIPITKKIA